VEPLEHRELLAAGLQAYVSGGNLYVSGTGGSDSIRVSQSSTQIAVAGITIATNNGPANSVNSADIVKLIIYGNGGNDTINLGTVKIDALVYAGNGHDTIILGTGHDAVVNGGGFDWTYRPYSPTTPIVDGLAVSDIHQGQDPLCQTDAALAEDVQQGYNFGNNIQYLGNNWYQVKLFGNLASQKVYYNGWTNSEDLVSSNKSEFWTVLMQRARLQALGIDPYKQYTMSQWDAFNRQTNGRLYSIGEAMYDFTGSVAIYSSFNGATPQALQAALDRGNYLVAQSQTGRYVSGDGIIGNHAYAVLGVYNDGGVWKVRLYNPWGIDRENGATIDGLDKSRPAANDGFITLTWQQFTNSNNFKGYFEAKSVGK
jgi:hypothetical protein